MEYITDATFAERMKTEVDPVPIAKYCWMEEPWLAKMYDARPDGKFNITRFFETNIFQGQRFRKSIEDACGFTKTAASLGGLELVGGAALLTLAAEIPTAEPVWGVPENIEPETRINLDYLPAATEIAFGECSHRRPEEFDLDFTVPPAVWEKIRPVSEYSSTLSFKIRENPNLFLITPSYSEGFEISITSREKNINNRRQTPCTSIDTYSFPVDSNLDVVIPEEHLINDLQLEMVGDVEWLNLHYDSTKSKAVAMRFLAQSLLVRDGKDISINFGDNQKERQLTFDWLLKSIVDVIRGRAQDKVDFDKLLYIANPNWLRLRDVLKKLIIYGFLVSATDIPTSEVRYIENK
jgi:hypothetical protein